jgi:hypothetical protein
MNPSIERLGALFAAAAWCDADGIGHTLYHVAKADLIFDQKPRQSNAVRFPRARLGRFGVLSFQRPSSRKIANGASACKRTPNGKVLGVIRLHVTRSYMADLSRCAILWSAERTTIPAKVLVVPSLDLSVANVVTGFVTSQLRHRMTHRDDYGSSSQLTAGPYGSCQRTKTFPRGL